MIDEIRSYFKARIAEVDTELTEHDQPFIFNNIPLTNLDYYYSIQLGNLISGELDQTSLDRLKVNVQIFGLGLNCTNTYYDSIYNKALEIRCVVCKKENVLRNNDFIENINLVSLTPNALPTDNNGFYFDLEFEVTISINH
jgi:hypothetical protein